MRPMFDRAVLAAAVLACGAGAARAASTTFSFTLSQSSSTLDYSFTASAPFGSSGSPAVSSTLIGADDPTQLSTEQTRTKRLSSPFAACGTLSATQNDAITVSGTIDASGSSSSPSTVHPGGTFKLSIDTGANTCSLQDLSMNLVASGAISASANLDHFTYQSFCAINPSCSLPFITAISLPLGEVDVTSLTAAQAPGVPDSGTLTPSGANTWTFSVPTTVTVTPTIVFSGAPLDAGAQQVPAVVAGTIVVSGNTAAVTASTQLNYVPPATAPGVQPSTPFTVPASSPFCQGINVILTLNILSSTVSSNTTANIVASGTKVACPCDTNGDGARTVQDIFDFLALWFAGSSRADFNGDTRVTVQDIFDFLACWFSSATPGC